MSLTLDHSVVHLASDFLPKKNFKYEELNQPEEIMGQAFAEVYLKNFSKVHSSAQNDFQLFLKEFPVNNLGIADLVAFSFSSDTLKNIRAFEFKIDDWRKGISQACRYKFYADASILVLPIRKICHASKFLDTFKSLTIGLWGFDESKKIIKKVYTPRPKKSYSNRYRKEALRLLYKYNVSRLHK